MTLDQAVNLYLVDGMSLNAIAQKHGFSRDRMSKELKSRGINLDNHYNVFRYKGLISYNAYGD